MSDLAISSSYSDKVVLRIETVFSTVCTELVLNELLSESDEWGKHLVILNMLNITASYCFADSVIRDPRKSECGSPHPQDQTKH